MQVITCSHAPFGAVGRGGVHLGCGFRQPNSEAEFGASVMVTPPYGSNAGSAQQRADMGIGPYEGRGAARRVVVPYGRRGTGDEGRETRDGRQETRDGRQETRDGRQGTEDGR